jgi:hypothetical protein
MERSFLLPSTLLLDIEESTHFVLSEEIAQLLKPDKMQ